MAFNINLDTSKAQTKIKSLNASIDKLAAKIKVVNTTGVGLGKVGSAARDLRSQTTGTALGMQNLNRSVTQLRGQLSTVALGVVESNAALSTMSKRSVSANKNLTKFRKGMDTTSKSAAGLRAAMYATGNHFGAFTAKTLLVATAVYAAIKSFSAMIAVGVEFTEKMARANAVMGNFDSSGALISRRANQVSKEVRRLGETTIFTVGEVADALVFLGMSGLSSADATKALEPVLKLASIGTLDAAKAADIATNVMLGFGKEAGDLAEIVDVMASAVTNSNMDIQQLGQSLSYVAPVAEATNNSLNDTVAILQIFHNVGIKASRAGTSLRRAMINLSSPTDKVQKVLTKLNVVMYDQENKMKPLVNIMRQFSKAGATMADISNVFGARAAPAMLAFYKVIQSETEGSISAMQRFRKEADESSGAATTLMARIEDVLGADWKKLVSAMSELGLKVFKTLEPALRSIVKGFTTFIRVLDDNVILGITASLYAMATAAGVASVTTGRLAVVMAIMAGPVGWAALAAGVGLYLYSQRDATKETLAAASAQEIEAESLSKLRKLKRDLNELSLEDLRIKGRKLDAQAIRASAELAKAVNAEAAAQENVLSKRREFNKLPVIQTSAEAAKSRKPLLKNLAIAELIRDSSVAQLKVQKENTKALMDERDVLQGISKERTDNVTTMLNQKKELFKKVNEGKPLDYKSVIASEKLITQEKIRAFNIAEKTNKMTAGQARAGRIRSLQEESKVIMADFKSRIAAQEVLTSKSRDFFDAVSIDKAAGITSQKDANEAMEVQIKKTEKLTKARDNYNRTNKARILLEQDKRLTAGQTVVDSLKSPLALEVKGYEKRKTALQEFYQFERDELASQLKHKYITEKDFIAKKQELQKEESSNSSELAFRSGATKVAITAQYVGSIIDNLAQSTNIRYQMSRKEAEDSYSLWQESLSRQEQFRNAANNAQTAGDENYYRNLQNQYKNYSATYKAQFEERDKIARSNFEKNKRMQIAQAWINTLSGAAMALGQLGAFGGPIAAAAILKLGGDMVSQIKSQQYQSPGSDVTTNAFGGLPSSPDNQGSGLSSSPRQDGQSSGGSLTININGGLVNEEFLYDELIPALQDGIENRDVVLIRNGSRNGQELQNV